MLFNVKPEDEKKSGIYIIKTDKGNYIGQTVNFKQRYSNHSSSGKMGKDSIFEIVEIINNLEIINKREAYWISFYNSFKNGLNGVDGPREIDLTKKHSIDLGGIFPYVKIIKTRSGFGRTDVLVVPESGAGQKWIEAGRVKEVDHE